MCVSELKFSAKEQREHTNPEVVADKCGCAHVYSEIDRFECR